MKKLFKIIYIIIILSIFSYSIVGTEAATKANTISELRNELAALKRKKNSEQSEKDKTEKELSESNQTIINSKVEISENQAKISKAKEDIIALNEKIANTKESIKNTMIAYQMTDGDNFYLEYVFEATSYEDMIYRYAVVEQIIDYNNEKINTYNDLIQQNEKLQEDLAKREIELNNQIDALSSKIESLGDKLSAFADVMVDIDEEIESTQELIDYYVNLGCDEDQDLNACVSVKGDTSFSKPTVKGTITSYYGYRINPLTGYGTKFHSGIDIGGNKEGVNIYAVANGMVGKIIRKSSCGGNQVYVFHTINGKKYTSAYLHLLDINVSVGDQVTSDTVVGTNGGGSQTYWDDCSTGPHLHLTIATGWYGGTGSGSYSSYSTYIANTLDPKELIGLPDSGIYWYSR